MSENVVEIRAETAERECVECRQPFTFKPIQGNDIGARMANAARRYCDPCIDALNAADAERDRQDKIGRRRKRSGIPREFAGTDLAALHPGHNMAAHAAALRWADGETRGLVLTGEIGVGKSTLAAAAVWKRLDRQGVQWASVPSLIAKAFGDREAKEHVAHVLTGTRSLVLDDIDKVKPGDWVASQLFAAVDNRVTAGAGLIVTTNLSVGQIAERFGGEFGDAIASRLAGFCEIHEMRGPDRRLR